jgi:glycosidase
MYEFHINRNVRKKYGLDTTFFSTTGNVVFANFHAVRLFVYKINQMRKPGDHVYPGEVNAAGLLEEIYHLVLREYEKQLNPQVFDRAEQYLFKEIGKQQMDDLMLDFIEIFPPLAVYQGKQTAEAYLKSTTGERPNSLITIEEMMMVWFANINRGNKKLKELFDTGLLKNVEVYRQFAGKLEDYFSTEPPFGPDLLDIFTLFKTPMLSHPDDLSAQLDFVLEKWKAILPENIVLKLLKGKDLLKEDVMFGGGGGAPPAIAPEYKGGGGIGDGFTIGKSGYHFIRDSAADYEEPERFTDDVHWMPRVVLLAKNTYVWLDQLSKKYRREIRRLDHIPDEELDQLVKWNFTGLWLIGIWERSEASRRIKHITGNIDAVSSAYSLYDYAIANDLGGEAAYHNLNERAKARGLRLASDMVPNHTGIYSKWTTDHPDYFIQTQHPPFPGYRFTGENLSQHPDIEIRIEDGYYSKTDAAVVFQWKDNRNGRIRYIYHGNDGTSMPWNDTAQLDMLKQEVREAVIRKIFEVAHKFSIIRFDAAMTLAKKHFSRLWYPRPGSGGDIPSRADHAMTKEAFDEMFPVEFWREVVDRMNETMPETLLLAEAFWFMEGYFVRTLGMHRVYNSAFMHMLKNEENEKYRDLITNTLEFEPEILKRYVNFMSNPDEETAIRQFGTGDKYFGICVLMNTLPGLPMFAHGQVEGFSEKYGMEYQRAYYNENPNHWLIEKHEREIFPLTRKRYLFSEVENFNIFDYLDNDGNINENVFAFTNRFRDERVLVLFNNKYDQAFGGIRQSAPRLTTKGESKEPVAVNFAQALHLRNDERAYYILKEHISGLEYLRSGAALHSAGFRWNLNGFEYRIFWNFEEVDDESGEIALLNNHLEGKGVPDIRQAFKEMKLKPVHDAFEAVFSDEILNEFSSLISGDKSKSAETRIDEHSQNAFKNLLRQAYSAANYIGETEKNLAAFRADIQSVSRLFRFSDSVNPDIEKLSALSGSKTIADLTVIGKGRAYRQNLIVLLAFFALKNLKNDMPVNRKNQSMLSDLYPDKPLQSIFKKTGGDQGEISRNIHLVNVLVNYGPALFDFGKSEIHTAETKRVFPESEKASLAGAMLEDENVKTLIGVNFYENEWYYSKERFEELTDWFYTLALLNYFANEGLYPAEALNAVIFQTSKFWATTRQISQNSGYKLEVLKRNIADRQ